MFKDYLNNVSCLNNPSYNKKSNNIKGHIMKNEIIINDKNISRYNKRLQKAISETLGQKIKLSEASE